MQEKKMEVTRGSFVTLPAKQVRLMAGRAIQELERKRKYMQDQLWEKKLRHERTKFFGFDLGPKYASRKEAESCEEYHIYGVLGWGDHRACELIAALCALAEANDENATINVTVEDFRALQ